MSVRTVLVHAKYLAAGLALMAVGVGGTVLVIEHPDAALLGVLIGVSYVCGRGICGGFKQPSDQEELERQNASMRRGGGMAE